MFALVSKHMLECCLMLFLIVGGLFSDARLYHKTINTHVPLSLASWKTLKTTVAATDPLGSL